MRSPSLPGGLVVIVVGWVFAEFPRHLAVYFHRFARRPAKWHRTRIEIEGAPGPHGWRLLFACKRSLGWILVRAAGIDHEFRLAIERCDDGGDILFCVPEVERDAQASRTTRRPDAGSRQLGERATVRIVPGHDRLMKLRNS